MTKSSKPDTLAPEFSRPVEAARLKDGETSMSLEAKAEERAGLAKRFGLQDISRLTAELLIDYNASKGDIRITGTLHAEIIQSCVVTLEPVPATIDAALIRNFTLHENDAEEPREVDLNDIAEEEPPESVKEGIIDAGEAVAEQLALEINPFPRAPGAEFSGITAGSASDSLEEAQNSGPFAALARLKGRSEN